ncbi:MAG: hypothetical protein ACYSOI_07800 [Planctomycetota bacterium]
MKTNEQTTTAPEANHTPDLEEVIDFCRSRNLDAEQVGGRPNPPASPARGKNTTTPPSAAPAGKRRPYDNPAQRMDTGQLSGSG